MFTKCWCGYRIVPCLDQYSFRNWDWSLASRISDVFHIFLVKINHLGCPFQSSHHRFLCWCLLISKLTYDLPLFIFPYYFICHLLLVNIFNNVNSFLVWCYCRLFSKFSCVRLILISNLSDGGQGTSMSGSQISVPAAANASNKDIQASLLNAPTLSLSQAQEKTSLFFALCSKVCINNSYLDVHTNIVGIEEKILLPYLRIIYDCLFPVCGRNQLFFN